MESHVKFTQIVQNISSFFGVTFKTKFPNSSIVFLQIFFAFVTIYSTFPTMDEVTKPIYVFVLIVQLIIPLIIGICINVEACKKKNIEEKIDRKLENLDKILNENFNVCEIYGVKFLCFEFISKLLVLIVIRVFKLFFAGAIISLCMMFPELVGSVSDYAFTLYIKLLTIRIKTYSANIKTENIEHLKIRKDFLAFYKVAQLITERFRVSLFLNITLNFVVLIINMYWIFIRIVYGPFR
jgi:hypothetical protein